MSVPFLLTVILLILMVIVGGKKGAKSFFNLFLNFIMILFMLILMQMGLDTIKVTIVFSVIITSFTLFYISGVNKKTVCSLLSVMLAILITVLMIYNIGIRSKVQGFGFEQVESVAYLSLYIKLDFTKLVICEIIIGLLGAVIDVSISISSSLNELYENNSSISRKDLAKSGMNIGRDILGTMTNTLFFAYVSEFMTLLIYFDELHYSISDIINTKIFCGDVFQVLTSGIGVILIIPITSYIMSFFLTFKSGADKVAKGDKVHE